MDRYWLVVWLLMLGVALVAAVAVVVVLAVQNQKEADQTYVLPPAPEGAPLFLGSSFVAEPSPPTAEQKTLPLYADLLGSQVGAAFRNQLWRRVVFPVAHDAMTGYMTANPDTPESADAAPWSPETGLVLPFLAYLIFTKGAFTRNTWELLFAWTRTQKGGLTWQLKGGVRGFDLRLFYSTTRQRMEFDHGGADRRAAVLIKRSANACWQELRTFLDANPSEIVALYMQHVVYEDAGRNNATAVGAMDNALDDLKTALGDLMLTTTMVADLDTATVGDILATSGRVIVFTNTDEIAPVTVAARHNDINRGGWANHYYAPQDPDACAASRTLLANTWQRVMSHYLHCYAYGGETGPFYLQAHIQSDLTLLEGSVGPSPTSQGLQDLATATNQKNATFLTSFTGAGRDDTDSKGTVALNGYSLDFYDPDQFYLLFVGANAAQMQRNGLL
jgi:hypothetical protein